MVNDISEIFGMRWPVQADFVWPCQCVLSLGRSQSHCHTQSGTPLPLHWQ